MIRCSGETKASLQDAARTAGMTLSKFMLNAAERAAASGGGLPKSPLQGKNDGLPAFFQELYANVREGGGLGFHVPALEICRRLDKLRPDDQSQVSWRAAQRELARAAKSEDDGEILDWFEEYLPRFVEVVPEMRKEQFCLGVYAFAEEAGW